MHVLALLLLSTSACFNTLAARLTGSFQDPSPIEKPRYRYWIPDASIDPNEVASDVKSAGAIGVGGLEILGYYAYGGFLGRSPPGIDWTTTGWGLPAWKTIQDVAIEATCDSNMVIDLALGPNQGAGVPTNLSDPGRAWQLVSYNITIPPGGSFNGILPGWGSGNLVAATIGLVIGSKSVSLQSGFPGSMQVPGVQYSLSTASLLDVTSQVQADGRIHANFLNANSNGSYILFGFYENQPLDYGQPPFSTSPVTDALHNGSWIVDHFSAAGAHAVIGFWQESLLDASNIAKLGEVGNYLWEDSQEYSGESSGLTVLWTPALVSHFATLRGYSLQKYLPLILYGNNGFNGKISDAAVFITDEVDGGQSHVSDYRQSLTELNRYYLITLDNWAKSLDLQFSAQPGYNLQVDMLAVIPDVAVPETESLGFDDNLDWYKQFTGPANLAQKKVVSSELGAVAGEVYSESIPEILWHIKRSLVSSINAFVIHGFAWSGNYPTCTWPSFTTFIYQFSEMHGPHLPAWEYYAEWMNYTARNSHILQNSIPKYDVAFWLKNVSYAALETRYFPTDLESAGYTYQYLSPDNLWLPAAVVVNSTLAPEAQAFKALVVRANDTLTSQGVQKLAQFAHAGLPILFSGGIPAKKLGDNPADQLYIESTMSTVRSLPNVHIVPYEGLAASLAQHSITPRTAVRMNRTVYTHWSKNSSDYVLIYNDAQGLASGGGSTNGTITFETSGNPYVYDAWSGAVEPIEAYSRNIDNMTVTIHLSLMGNQTLLVGFNNTESQKLPKITSMNSAVSIVSHGEGQYRLKTIASSIVPSLTLTNGSVVDLPPVSATAFKLSNWTMVMESWSAPANLTDSSARSIRVNTTHIISHLVSWEEITNRSMAGRAFYNTSFTWPPCNSSSNTTGAILDLGYIRHTARVWINDRQTTALDVTRAQVDIGPHLVTGINHVRIIVTSPLANAILPVKSDVGCLISTGNATQIQMTTNGLTRDVFILPYETTQVTL